MFIAGQSQKRSKRVEKKYKAFRVSSRITVTEEKAGLYLCWDTGCGDVPPHALVSKDTGEMFLPKIVYLRIDESCPTDIDVIREEPEDGWWSCRRSEGDGLYPRLKCGKLMYTVFASGFREHCKWDEYEFVEKIDEPRT